MKLSRALAFPLLATASAVSLHAQEIVDPDTGREEWYLPTEDGKCRLYVFELGLGEPVVVLHGGFGAEHGYLLDAVDGLEDDAHFVLYDQRGSLRSPCSEDAIDLDRHVADLDLLRRELGLDQLRLLAHSAGNLLALAYLDRHPERVSGLILTALAQPKSRMEPTDFPGGAYPEGFETAGERFQAFASRPEVRAELDAWDLLKTGLSRKEESRAWRIRFAASNLFRIERWTHLKGGQAFYSTTVARAMSATFPSPYDYLPALRAAKFPVTVIMGDHDFLDFGGAAYPLLFSDQGHIEVVQIRDAGHSLWVDQPEAFRKAAKRALRK